MLINSKDAEARLKSGGNLLNRLKDLSNKPKQNPMALFVGNSSGNKRSEPTTPELKSSLPVPYRSEPPAEIPESPEVGIDDILDDNEAKIKLAHAHDKAIELLTNSVATLATKLNDVKADKLPAVITAASKTIESIRRERLEAAKQNTNKEVHFHFYTPKQKQVEDYAIVEVS